MGLNDALKDQVAEAIFAGRQLKAIKIYRDATGQGLQESKEFVEALTQRLRQEYPDRFPLQKSGCGMTVGAGIFVASLLAYTWWA